MTAAAIWFEAFVLCGQADVYCLVTGWLLLK